MDRQGEGHSIRIEPNPDRIRVMLGGFILAETTRALTLKEGTHPPALYIPREDARMDLLEPTERRTRCPFKGEAGYFTAQAGGVIAKNAAWSYESPNPGFEAIAGRVAFYPDKVDAIETFRD